MNKLTIILIITIASFASAELINVNPDPNGEPWWAGGWKNPTIEEQAQIDALPKLTLPKRYKKSVKTLPYKLDNSQLMYFRPVFNQVGGSCAQASGVGYNFTYQMNFLNGTDASLPPNQFPTHYTYNFLNDGSGANGSTYFGGWDIINAGGIPDVSTYGGLWPATDSDKIWMDGFTSYRSGMNRRTVEVQAIPVGTPEGLEVLKQYFNDYCDGSPNGGIVNFSAGVSYTFSMGILPINTENQGQHVVLKWDQNVNHAMTFVGYNDSIRWDFNTDGKFTNDIDTNGDGQVDMLDWEKGGLLMANSWGTDWADGGKAWVAYRTLAKSLEDGGIWLNTVHTIRVRDDFSPSLFLKTTVNFSDRKELKIFAGVSADTAAAEPEHIVQFPHFNYQGGAYGMAGDGNILEFGLDISPLLSYVQSGEKARFFIGIEHKQDGTSGRGSITSFSIIDELNNEYISPETGVQIAPNSVTYAGVNAEILFDGPAIYEDFLPAGEPGVYYEHNLTATGGTGPYKWDMIFDYSEAGNTSEMLNIAGTPLNVTNDDDGFAVIDLPFSFPFYGELFDQVTVITDGSILFGGQFEYVRTEGDILAFKTVTPYGADLMAYPEEGDGIYTSVDENSLTVRWITSMWDMPEVDLDFECRIYADSRIEFFYGDSLTSGINWASGVSNGKSTDAEISSFSNLSDPSGLKTAFTTNDFPYGMTLSENGIFSGITQEANKAWNINFRVTDDRNISSIKSIEFYTTSSIDHEDALIMSDIELLGNYPNPFNPSTVISFASGSGSELSLKIFNSSGEVVDTVFENRKFEKGYHSVKWTAGSKFTSGTYFIGLKNGKGNNLIRKISLLK